MGFTVVYYVCIACPTIDRTIEMVDRYVAHGAKALQIDMPSKDPFAETEFVKMMMKASLSANLTYDDYMNGIREIRRRHPHLELHIVVYNDVVESIGAQRLVDFGKEIGAASFMIPGCTEENRNFVESRGIKIFRRITHHMEPEDIKFCAEGGSDAYISLRNRKPGEHDVRGFETWPAKYDYVRKHGVVGKIYSVFGIQDAQTLRAIHDTGAQGAIIGNVLMKLWDEEDKLWPLFDSFQQFCD